MSQDQDQGQEEPNPEARALSGDPDLPPQQPDHTEKTDRELLDEDEDEEKISGKPASNGDGGSDQPGTTLPGYG